MDKRMKVLVVGAALGLGTMLPLTVIGGEEKPETRPPDRVSRRVQIAPNPPQLVPHVRGETCPPTPTRRCARRLLPTPTGGR